MGKERKRKNAIVLVCVRVNVDVRLLCFRWNQARRMYDCTNRRKEENQSESYRTGDDDIYYISYTRMNTTPSPPGEKTALVASFACACARFRLFRFGRFSSLGVDVVIRSTIAKEKWNKYTQISWI